jgi:glycosyltransferase involved in cell wall biosynthesis
MAEPRVPLTVVIPALNEAHHIDECVRHVGWADEIIVVDGGSTDATVELARAAGATVLDGHGVSIASQRNIAIATARNPWVLALDADERVTDDLRAEISEVLRAPAHRAYRVRRQNYYLGQELTRGRWGRDWVLRLFTRELRYAERRVHESVQHAGPTGRLHANLRHTPYRDLAHQLEKMNRYARWGAEDMYEQGRRARLWDLVVRPLSRFLRAYLLQGAIWDGRDGLVTSVLGGYTAFLKYAHLWALERER